jgi:hypothetical protein
MRTENPYAHAASAFEPEPPDIYWYNAHRPQGPENPGALARQEQLYRQQYGAPDLLSVLTQTVQEIQQTNQRLVVLVEHLCLQGQTPSVTETP